MQVALSDSSIPSMLSSSGRVRASKLYQWPQGRKVLGTPGCHVGLLTDWVNLQALPGTIAEAQGRREAMLELMESTYFQQSGKRFVVDMGDNMSNQTPAELPPQVSAAVTPASP